MQPEYSTDAIPNVETLKSINELEAGNGELFTGSTEDFFKMLVITAAIFYFSAFPRGLLQTDYHWMIPKGNRAYPFQEMPSVWHLHRNIISSTDTGRHRQKEMP